ncbi:class I SAM-dependent methyltransferase [Sinorhizobium meliloti]|uniref:class I SAM-dependent methyltransferase n=1 Tax=Rhizobium meliloti TaxID=382 RepID=UPI002380051C|nr:class I SAM-dependent methyltransferase [Sinorhizobium meliloti]MDE3797601.1 class I SAM-dependent methyltransferase [Sinorhizobium meliloti]
MQPFEQRGTAILKRTPAHAKAAEIGVLIGVLSEFLLRSRRDLKLLMVDSWAPAEQQPEQYKLTGDTHASHDLARVRRHRQEAEARVKRFTDRATIMPVTSLVAAEEIAGASLDLVFIDADHSYEGVKADIAAWLPKIRTGGWIGGHDYRNPDPRFRFGVDRAVDEWSASTGRQIEMDLNFTWFARV